MKESVLDVLIYLFDHYVEEEMDMMPSQAGIKKQLAQAGFADIQINKAINWLEGLVLKKTGLADGHNHVSANNSIRVYSNIENEKLDRECRGFLLFLEQTNVIDGDDRELVIDRVMALEHDVIGLQQLKWVILMVFFNHPGKEEALVWIEGMMLDGISKAVH